MIPGRLWVAGVHSDHADRPGVRGQMATTDDGLSRLVADADMTGLLATRCLAVAAGRLDADESLGRALLRRACPASGATPGGRAAETARPVVLAVRAGSALAPCRPAARIGALAVAAAARTAEAGRALTMAGIAERLGR